MAMTITPLDATLGAEVRGVSLRSVDDRGWHAVLDAFHEHAVLVFPGQHLLPAEQVELSRRLGTLELVGRTTLGSTPELSQISNLRRDGSINDDAESASMRVVLGNMGWHSDSSFRVPPAKASMLSCERAPSRGGETEFADMRAAYDALDEPRRRELDDLVVTHSYLYSQGSIGGLEAKTFTDEQRANMGPTDRPLVNVHDVTGRRSLAIGRHVFKVQGMADDVAQRLLDDLLEWACRPPRVIRHSWQPGDIVMWDNRSVLHRLRPWDYTEARIMWHTRIAGDLAPDSAQPVAAGDRG